MKYFIKMYRTWIEISKLQNYLTQFFGNRAHFDSAMPCWYAVGVMIYNSGRWSPQSLNHSLLGEEP